MRYCLIKFVVLLHVLCLPAYAAANLGRIAGTVKNKDTGLLLQGAAIEIVELHQTANTDELGRFSFPRLPLGAYTIQVNYTSLQPESLRVLLAENAGTAELHIELMDPVYQMEKFVVSGEREGNAAAITRQRTADNVKTVVSMDAIGFLPNENPADLLITLPGVIGNDDGEGTIVTVNIRGVDSNFNSVTYDGAQMATSWGLSNRSFRFLNINASAFDEMEVIKAPTPDMSASSQGGSINMKTKSTLNMKEDLLFTYRAGFRVTPSFFDYAPSRKDNPFGPLATLRYRQIFSVGGDNRNLGASLELFHSTKINNMIRTQMDYGATPDGEDTYIWKYYTTESVSKVYLDSATLRIDYKYSDKTRFFISTMYSQNRDVTNPGMENMTNKYTASNSDVNFTADSTDQRSQATAGTMQLVQGYIGFLDKQTRAQIGAEHKLDWLELSYDFAYSNSSVELDGGRNKNYSGNAFYSEIRNVSAIIDRTGNDDFPTFTQVYTTPDANIYDIDNYTKTTNTTYLMHREGTRDGTNYQAKIDAKSILSAFGHPVRFSTGMSWLQVGLDEVGDTERWNYQGPSLAQFLDNGVELDNRFGNGITSLPRFNMSLVSNDWKKNENGYWVYDEYTTLLQERLNSRNIQEDIYAAYLMARTRFGRLTALVGARFEYTDYEVCAWARNKGVGSGATNQEKIDDMFGTSMEKVTNSYSDVFPGVHLTYSIIKNFMVRANWSTSIGRPKPLDMVSWMNVNSTAQTITVGNPNLKPQYGDSFDISLEYYLKPSGVLSVGVFRKRIKDFIYTEYSGTIDASSEFSNYLGYTVNTISNGERATIDGLELTYQQTLAFLPKPLNGITLTLNYTVLDMEGNYNSAAYDAPPSTSDIIGFIPTSANARLQYRYRNFGFGASVNYTDGQLLEYSPDWSRLKYRKSRMNVGMNASYRFQRFMEFFVSVGNLTDEPYVNYRGTESRRETTIYNGPYIDIGFSGRF